MSDLMQRELGHSLPGSPEPFGQSEEPSTRGNPLMRMLRSTRRHWLMVLLVWIVTAGPAVPFIWMNEKPTYTASARVEIAANETPILYQMGGPPVVGEAFINTQAELISSSAVLRGALSDPTLKDISWISDPDAINSLRRSLTVTPVSRSYLLQVSVVQGNPADAIKLTRAVMRAYEVYAGASTERGRADRIRIAREERDRIKSERERLNRDLLELAGQQASSSEAVYDLLQESSIKLGTAALLSRGEAENQRAVLKSQLEALEKGLVPTTMPTEDQNWKEEFIENDRMVSSIKAEQARVAQWLVKPRKSPAYEEEMRRLETLLAVEKARAAKEADRKLEERHKAILDSEKQRIQIELNAVESRIAYLDVSRQKADAEGKQVGKLSLEIQKKKSDLKAKEQQLLEVEDSVHKLEVELHRPAPISVDTNAEILPGGIKDRRKKLMGIAVMGGLFLGVCLAVARDFLSGRLYTTEDVDLQAGLRLLGAVPSIDDLRRGRISKDDFRESYRAIRATLAGGSPDGQVPRCLLVTSAQAAEGKTSLAVSLAASLAESGLHVLVIDGDVQAPRIGSTLKLNLPFRLRHVLLGECQLTGAVGPTPVPGLDVLLGGRNGQSAEGLLNNRAALQILKAATERYDHVIVDSPPVLGSADALIWAQSVNGVILSSFAGHSNLRIIRHACQRIASAGGKILGAVLCNVSARESYYSYSYCSKNDSPALPNGQSDVRRSGSREPPCFQLGGEILNESPDTGKGKDA